VENILGNATGFILQKKIIQIMVGAGPRHTRGGLFRKLNILPNRCVYIFALMMFVINNLEKFQTNSFIHGINTRNSAQLHRPVANLSSYQRGVYYSGIKLFNSLPINIINLKNNKKQFRIALQSYLQKFFLFCKRINCTIKTSSRKRCLNYVFFSKCASSWLLSMLYYLLPLYSLSFNLLNIVLSVD
jgi:hypothetical protein